MKIDRTLVIVALALGGCAARPNPAAAPMRPPGVMHPPAVALAPVTPAPAPALALAIPDRIEFPATYRLIQLEGHLVLVRDADSHPLAAATTSLRVVTGEVARGELAYQPALLPQELATEVAAHREGAARLDQALSDVMARSRTLSAQALELKAQSQKLADLLAAAEARLRAADAAAKPVPSAAPPSD